MSRMGPTEWLLAAAAGFATMLLVKKMGDGGMASVEPGDSQPSDLAQAIIQQAQKCVGFSADPAGGTRQAYLDLIAPGETAASQEQMSKMSGCGLVIGGFWRRAGIVDPSLDPPYKVGTAVNRLYEIARKNGAWIAYKSGQGMLPSPGDMVLVGNASMGGNGGIEHVFTVTSATDEATIRSIDGGQVDSKGFQCITEKERVWTAGWDAAKKANDPGGAGSKRLIIGWAAVSKLAGLRAGFA